LIWLIVGVVGALAVAYTLRRKPSTAVKFDISDQKSRAQLLSDDEQEDLAQEARRLALAGYDRLSEAARVRGKSESFSHEAGVLDAAFCVLANDDAARRNEDVRRAMQMETIPFNKLEPELGRVAVAEYLVWKFFPNKADTKKLRVAIREFVDDFFATDAVDDDRFVFEMIYANRYDWQKLAAEEAKNRLKAPDA
jgi:hypothetical protein